MDDFYKKQDEDNADDESNKLQTQNIDAADNADVSDSERQKAIRIRENQRKYIVGIATSGLFIALMVISARISIPIGPISITLQFLVTNLCFMLLGKKWGGIATLLYLILGLFGLPIFNGGGGFAYALKPSFGFLIGFLVGGFVGAWYREKTGKTNFAAYMIASLIDMLIMDVIGVAYGAVIMYGYMHSTKGVWEFLMGMLIPFIPIDLAKCAVGAAICPRLGKYCKI